MATSNWTVGNPSVKTAEAAQREIERCHPDFLVLDLMLADGDNGLEILRRFRDRKFPVLVYTSRDEEQIYGKLWSTAAGARRQRHPDQGDERRR
jgi:DNA-binding response OmpR family regulator